MTPVDRPTVVLAADDPAETARVLYERHRATALDDLPAKPFALAREGLLAYATLRDEHDCEAALVALARGVDLVVSVAVPEPHRAAFLDDLARAADVVAADRRDVSTRLSADQVALLEGLADGRTLTDMASALGLSRRTATRRVAEARRILGAETTVEAFRMLRHDPASSQAKRRVRAPRGPA
jgi:DNA-binding NarL/FixJ family response regulator